MRHRSVDRLLSRRLLHDGTEDIGSHTICAVVTAEFLEHQRSIGNDLSTPMPQYRFPGLVPGDRWCVTAVNWLRAYEDGAAAYVVLASTHERALEIVPLTALQEHAVDVPADPSRCRTSWPATRSWIACGGCLRASCHDDARRPRTAQRSADRARSD